MMETAKSEITNDKELRDIESQFRPVNPLKSEVLADLSQELTESIGIFELVLLYVHNRFLHHIHDRSSTLGNRLDILVCLKLFFS